MPFTAVDLLTDSGDDLVIDSNGDLKLATERETLERDTSFRLQTQHFDYGPSPYIGADLQSLLGEPNTRRTGDLIREHVHISLTQDNRVPAGVLFVDVVPLSVESVEVFVIISDRIGTEVEPSVVTHTLNFLPPLSPPEESILNFSE